MTARRIKWMVALVVSLCLVTWPEQGGHAQMPPRPFEWDIIFCNNDGTVVCAPICHWKICCND